MATNAELRKFKDEVWELKKKLDAVEQERDHLQSEVDKTKNKLEAATKALESIAFLLEHNPAENVQDALTTFACNWQPKQE